MPVTPSVSTSSLVPATNKSQDNGPPLRPPHPLLLKAVDSQIHLLFKAWMHYAYSLPLTSELGAAEIYSQMDARVQLFAVITYEFNRLIAEFAIEYGKDHDCLRESSVKDVTAYTRCNETDIAKLCARWNEYSETFEDKFKEARRERLPKREANLMKEELSRLLYICKAMEKVWLETTEQNKSAGSSGKDDGIKKWIADTNSQFKNKNEARQLDKASMEKVLKENAESAARFAENLKERLERRKYAILSNNYIEIEEVDSNAHQRRRRVTEKGEGGRSSTGTNGKSNTSQPGSMTDSLWDGQGNMKHLSEGSYDEFDINDMRYLTPMLFPQDSKGLVAPPPTMIPHPPLTPTQPKYVTVFPPPDYPPPPLPISPNLLRPKRSGGFIQSSHLIMQTEDIASPLYPASTRSCSTGSSLLVSTPKEPVGFSFKGLFSSKPRAVSAESTVEVQKVSELVISDPIPLTRKISNNAISPTHLPPNPFKSIRQAASTANLRSPQSAPVLHGHLENPPDIPVKNPRRQNPRLEIGPNLNVNGVKHGPKMTANTAVPGDNTNRVVTETTPTFTQIPRPPIVKMKGSTFFNGTIIKEIPKGKEDPFLERYAYRGDAV